MPPKQKPERSIRSGFSVYGVKCRPYNPAALAALCTLIACDLWSTSSASAIRGLIMTGVPIEFPGCECGKALCNFVPGRRFHRLTELPYSAHNDAVVVLLENEQTSSPSSSFVRAAREPCWRTRDECERLFADSVGRTDHSLDQQSKLGRFHW